MVGLFSYKGWAIKEDQRGTFLDCQMCTETDCRFRPCSDFLNSSIYCKSITDTSHSQITESIKTSQGEFSASTFMSNHFTSREVVVSKLQLNITIQTSHHQLMTRSKCQVILFRRINRKIEAIF